VGDGVIDRGIDMVVRCVFEAECGSLVDGGACAFLKLAQWDFNNFIPASTGVYESYGGGEAHDTMFILEVNKQLAPHITASFFHHQEVNFQLNN
jgi:hypothetical protein